MSSTPHPHPLPQGGRDIEALQAQTLGAARQMSAAGLVIGTSGNVSAREPGAPEFWITPSGVDYKALTIADLVCVDLTGEKLSGTLRPSSDTPNHAAIYRQRVDVGGIVHTHSTYATVFAVLRREILPILVEAAGFLGGPVRVMEYVPWGQPDAPEQVARALASERALLLPNHGVIAVGASISEALIAAQLVEHSARVAYLAAVLGSPSAVPPEDIARIHQFLHREYGQRDR